MDEAEELHLKSMFNIDGKELNLIFDRWDKERGELLTVDEVVLD
jgi:hypothetical protein